MINQHSAIRSLQSDAAAESRKVQDGKTPALERGANPADINGKKEEFKKVAKEMESLFAFQLLKIMRETTDNMSTDKKENGYDTYMSMFDMEVSKLFADRGLGLQDAIINWLERSQGLNEKDIISK